jgi:hypothetical protein
LQTNKKVARIVDATASSTFKDIAQDTFKIKYGDGTSSTGDYFTDQFTIGGSTVNSLVMGLATSTDNPYGLIGVGLPSNEAIVNTNPEDEYINLPLALVNQSLITSAAYSLWLNDLRKFLRTNIHRGKKHLLTVDM